MSDSEETPMQELDRSQVNLEDRPRPIVIEYKKRKKKRTERDQNGKARYSSGLKDVQVVEGDVMRIAQKASKALSKGIDTYEKERQKSALGKKDGAVDDYFYNSAKAASAYFKETADLPVDLVDSLNRTSFRRRMRKNLRRTSRNLRMWRL